MVFLLYGFLNGAINHLVFGNFLDSIYTDLDAVVHIQIFLQDPEKKLTVVNLWLVVPTEILMFIM